MEKNKSALVAGATGLIGRALLKKLAASDAYNKIYVLSRKDFSLDDPKVIIKKVDFEQLESLRDEFFVDDVFCSLGTTLKKAGSREMFYKIDHDLVIKFAELGLNNGGKKFLLVTALGADRHSKFYYNRVKGAIEQDVAGLGYKNVVICRPGLLLGEREESRPLEKIGQVFSKWISSLLVGKLKKYRPIKAEMVAESMITVAQQNEQGVKIIESEELQKIASEKV